MPQIMCPNCGMTINLENRKKIDQDLIMSAVKKKPRTFTELLHITKLSRKTLSFRLKELCVDSAIVKQADMYRLNGVSGFENNRSNLAKGFSDVLHDRRIRTGLMLIALLTCSSVSGYVFATFLAPKEEPYQGPVIIGNFTMALDIHNVEDLYGWQAAIFYNQSQLTVLKIAPESFVGMIGEYPLFVSSTDNGNLLLIAGSLFGDVHGNSGSGRLATVVFGYFTKSYDEPKITLRDPNDFETLLLNSNGQSIPVNESTLTLTVVGQP
jgi:hypothetical protein